MNDEISLKQTYAPERLIDYLVEYMCLENDVALARVLEVAPPVISKIRNKQLTVDASVFMRMHEVTNLSINDLRFLMGDRRDRYRLSVGQRRLNREATVPDISLA